MRLSNAQGVHGVCSLACWALDADETPTGCNIVEKGRHWGVGLMQPYCFLIK